MKHLLIDCGHGGFDPKTGKYTTKDSKRYTFTDQDDTTVWEGELNRLFGAALAGAYSDHTFVSHPWKDTSLEDRVDLANAYHKVHGDTIYLALHNNARSKSLKGPSSDVRGAELWTSPGYTPADPIATAIYNELKLVMPKIRTDKYRDGDPDKEKLLYVTKNTIMPAVLIEYDFFDNWEAVVWLSQTINQINCAQAAARALKQF